MTETTRREDRQLRRRERSPIAGLIIGGLVILVGLSQVFNGTLDWLIWNQIWPYLLIAVGVAILYRSYFKR